MLPHCLEHCARLTHARLCNEYDPTLPGEEMLRDFGSGFCLVLIDQPLPLREQQLLAAEVKIDLLVLKRDEGVAAGRIHVDVV